MSDKQLKAIVITKSENEVAELYGAKFNNIGFMGNKRQNYDTEWHWIVEGDNISGSSGYHSLENIIERKPGYKIYYFKDYKSMQP